MKTLARRHRASRYLLVGFAALTVLLATIALSRRAFASPTLDAANHAFAEGHFAQAAAKYQTLIDEHGYSAPALLDLGNAQLRDGKPVEAILAYERARLIAPRDAAIANNLAEARKAAGVEPEPKLADRISHVLTANESTWLATAGVWLGLAFGAAAVLFPRRRPWLTRGASMSVIAGAVGIVALVVARGDAHAALVMKAAPVLVSPFDGAQSSFSLHAGSDIELGSVHDGFVLVRDRGGESGWVDRAAVTPLIAD
jgi:hypothetical protein